MTAYHGGKQKIGKEIAKIVSNTINDSEGFLKGYCEPFCGMLGVYQHVPELITLQNIDFLAGDINNSLILMWQHAQKGWIPPTNHVSYDEFQRMGHTLDSSPEKGFIGHHLGYMGKYFKGYKNNKTINSNKKVADRVVKIANKLSDVKFTQGEYKQFSHLENYVIYCDPPYNIQSGYYEEGGKRRKKFDFKPFYQWCEEMSKKNNIVYISEYECPYEALWTDGKEKLFLV